MEFENVFVTVGTTRFDNLIKTVTSPNILQVLKILIIHFSIVAFSILINLLSGIKK